MTDTLKQITLMSHQMAIYHLEECQYEYNNYVEQLRTARDKVNAAQIKINDLKNDLEASGFVVNSDGSVTEVNLNG